MPGLCAPRSFRKNAETLGAITVAGYRQSAHLLRTGSKLS